MYATATDNRLSEQRQTERRERLHLCCRGHPISKLSLDSWDQQGDTNVWNYKLLQESAESARTAILAYV